MHTCQVELRDKHGRTKVVQVLANNHQCARLEAEARYGLLVLSTEFLE